MRILRTPDHRFQNLYKFPFEPHYYQIGELRLHYIDEGPKDSEPILMLHGEPTWSYLYRKLIPIFSKNGFRALAPDFIGFGRSDKPAEPSDYSYPKLVEWTKEWLLQMSIERITLICQDWGSFIGLQLVADFQQLFSRVIVANGFLPDGGFLSPAFYLWQFLAKYSPIFPVDWIVRIGCVSPFSREVRAAYRAPFPDKSYFTGPRVLPQLVPTQKRDLAARRNQKAWEQLRRWEKPFITIFGDHDPIFAGMDKRMQNRIPGAIGQCHRILSGAGHFIQEDRGPELANLVMHYISKET